MLPVLLSPKSDRQRPREGEGTKRAEVVFARRRTERASSVTSARKTRHPGKSGRKRKGSLSREGEKWQTLSCHEALDVFILPQAVLEERRSLRNTVHLDRTRGLRPPFPPHSGVSRNPLNSYETWARRARRTPTSIESAGGIAEKFKKSKLASYSLQSRSTFSRKSLFSQRMSEKHFMLFHFFVFQFFNFIIILITTHKNMKANVSRIFICTQREKLNYI